MPKTIDKATALSTLTDQLKEAKAEAKTLGDPKRSPKAAECAGKVAALTATIKVVKSIADTSTAGNGAPYPGPGDVTTTAAANIV